MSTGIKNLRNDTARALLDRGLGPSRAAVTYSLACEAESQLLSPERPPIELAEMRERALLCLQAIQQIAVEQVAFEGGGWPDPREKSPCS